MSTDPHVDPEWVNSHIDYGQSDKHRVQAVAKAVNAHVDALLSDEAVLIAALEKLGWVTHMQQGWETAIRFDDGSKVQPVRFEGTHERTELTSPWRPVDSAGGA